MPDLLMVPVASLLIDELNPRLAQPSTGQSEAIRALAEVQGRKLQGIAKDIVDHGLNPSDLMIVVPFGGDDSQYVVLDGNRRLTALRALENPELLDGVATPGVQSAIRKLSETYRNSPIHELQCVVFDERDDANHWIELGNTGERGGAGPVQWGSDETDRFRTRTGGQPNLATQVLDFLEQRGNITPEQRRETAPTTLTRILGSPDIRPKLGLDHASQYLYAVGALDDVANALTHVVTEIGEGRLGVTDVYTKQQRLEFANSFPAHLVVGRTSAPGKGTALRPDSAPSGGGQPRASRPQERPRNRLIPETCSLNVTDARTHDIERELRLLNLDRMPNAIAVLFRVFIELSVDSYLQREGIAFSDRTNLHEKLNTVADDLTKRQRLNRAQAAPVRRAAARNSFLGPSVTMMHQWVHNQHLSPTAAELRSHWNDLQPFLSAVWAP